MSAALKKSRQSVCLFLTFIMLISPTLWANSKAYEIARLAHPDTVFYNSSSGIDAIGPLFEKTTINKLWSDPAVQSFYNQLIDGFRTAYKKENNDPNKAQLFDNCYEFAKYLCWRPTLFGVIDNTSQAEYDEPFTPYLVIDAGPRKAEFASLINKLAISTGCKVESVKVAGMEFNKFANSDIIYDIYFGWVGDKFVAAFCDSTGAAASSVAAGGSYAPVSPFNGLSDETDDSLMLFEHGRFIEAMLKAYGNQDDTDDMPARIRTALDILGIQPQDNIALRSAYAGKDVIFDCSTRLDPQRGVWAACLPIQEYYIDMIDTNSAAAAAFSLDVPHLYQTIVDAAVKINPDPNGFDEITTVFREFESSAGVDVVDDILFNFTGPIVYYSYPMGSSFGLYGGAVIVADITNTDQFTASLEKFCNWGVQQSDNQLQLGKTTRPDGITLYGMMYAPLAMAQMMPTWSVVDGKFVLATNQNLCSTAIDKILAAKNNGSIANGFCSSDIYTAVQPQLPNPMTDFTYLDSGAILDSYMMSIQQFWPWMTMGAAQEGINLPVMLPQISHITSQMNPAIDYGWYDSQGYHSHYKGSGVEYIVLYAAATGAIAVLMPAISKTKSHAKMIVDGSNLRQISLSCIMYSADNEGKFPDNLQEINSYLGDSAQDVKTSPLQPGYFKGSSYIIVPGHTDKSPPTDILAYTNPAFLCNEINVAYVDGHVEKIDKETFLNQLEQTYKHLGKPMPEIIFGSER